MVVLSGSRRGGALVKNAMRGLAGVEMSGVMQPTTQNLCIPSMDNEAEALGHSASKQKSKCNRCQKRGLACPAQGLPPFNPFSSRVSSSPPPSHHAKLGH